MHAAIFVVPSSSDYEYKRNIKKISEKLDWHDLMGIFTG